jgi:spermidine synthase
LNVAAALVASRLTIPASLETVRPRFNGGTWLSAAFLSGFCLLALEVVWFRFLLLFVSGEPLAFAVMLGVVLAGIAVGGLAAAQGLRVAPEGFRFGAAVAFSAGVLCIASYAAFPLVMTSYGLRAIDDLFDILPLCIFLMFPVSVLSGVLFPLLGAALRTHVGSASATTGALTFSNTAGAALGALAGGFFLLPVLGIERSFFFLALLYGGLGTWLLLARPDAWRLACGVAAVLVASVVFFPFGSIRSRLVQIPVNRFAPDGTARIVAVREGLTETIIYVQSQLLGKPAYYGLLTNSFSMSGTPSRSRRYMKLYVYWPMAVHPNLKHALLVAYGVGNTAKAMTDSKSLETIDVVDISRDILETTAVVYPREADNPLRDSRVRTHVEDGRFFLQMTDRRFDLITSEPPPPGMAGVENLYTREYFQLLHDRLANGGIVTYWLPLQSLTDVSTKAILRGFCDAFDDCSLWNGRGTNLMMVGTRNANGPVPEEQFVRQWNDPVVAAEMTRLGFERPEQLGALFIGDADYLKELIAGARALVDDDPKLIGAPIDSPEEVTRLFLRFTDTAESRARFRRSPLIARLWPARLLVESLPYFEFQDIINAYFDGNHVPTLDVVRHILTDTSLKTLVLWCLGSDSDSQEIVASADAGTLTQPDVQFHLGVQLMAERRYAAAVEPLRQAEASPVLHDSAAPLRIVALCMSGQIRECF